MKNKKLKLMQSIISLVLCISMLTGTTFAWFTDSVVTGINTIAAGVLDVELYHTNAAVTDEKVDGNTELFLDLQGDPILWEPGVVSYENLRIANEGDLALAYQLAINTANENYIVYSDGTQYGLSQILKVGVVEGGITASDRAGVVASVEETNWTTMEDFLRSGSLIAEGDEETWGIVIYWEPGDSDNFWNLNNGKTLSSGEALSIDLGIKLVATQEVHESDSFGNDYDTGSKAAVFPDFVGGSASAPVAPNEQGLNPADVTITSGQVSAFVPAGVKLASGTTKLDLNVSMMGASGSNITLGENEDMRSMDVHIDGVAEDNTVPMTITLMEAAPTGLNLGNYKVYHVENGKTNEMTLVDAAEELNAHNQFKYDPVTGDVTLYMATFSEVAIAANTENAWKGEFDYSWYTNAVAPVDGETVTAYIIANADQLAGFGAIVGGMNSQTKDSFSGKTVKLVSDINLGDAEAKNNSDLIFYPIGYYNSTGSYEKKSGDSVTSNVSSFEGTFDGQGHTIANFYQNTWEMFGDYNDGYDGTPNHYKDAMGLFGYVKGGKVKNLTVDHFSSDGEFTPTGVIAAYADGDATFENIAITNCNPRVYNTGNGGIIGIAGSTGTDDDSDITLRNITVDNSNKISALWGSYDVACGGLVGMYRGNVDGSGNATGDTISFNNCHVSAIIDVYNDVCGNYQYYAYRYAGMIIGSVRHNTTNADDKTIPNMTGISATDCTVNYGDWNDYYYCEFEKNGHPSYSGPDDYKFSRVPNSEIDTSKGKENATCIGHNHTDVEDNQAIYLPFHQLFTGYGWGVNSIGLEKYSGIITNLDITEGDQEESVEKFAVALSADTTLKANESITVGSLFKAIEGANINSSAVQVSVSAMNDCGIVGTYTANTSDWTKGTLTFNKIEGMCTVTIQDYNFCKPTSFVLKDGKLYNIEKFKTKFTGNFLYRVGNVNAVTLSSLFEAVNGTPMGAVTVNVENVKGNASGTYTANGTWDKGTIQFSGTGVVKVTIEDEDVSGIPTILMLEVVDATNVSENGKIGNYNTTSVLLGNTTVSTLYLNGGAALYGNGFTIDCTNSPVNGTGNVSENYIIGLAGANLDNVKIVGKVYTEYGAVASSNYNRALIISTGNSTITNCYLSNTAAPIRINSGNLTVKDSTVKGGNFANIDVRSGHLTLDNVTTINQAKGNDKAEDGSTVIGLGVVVYYEMVNASATSITVKNGLTQFNNISSDDKFSNEYAQQFVTQMFSTANSALQYNNGNTKWVNTGIILMTSGINVIGAGDKVDVSFLSKTGAVYTVKPTAESIEDEPAKDTVLAQGLIKPSATLDHDDESKGNYIPKEAGKNDYCYFDGEKILISMDQGDTFQYDPFILNATKLGEELNYTVEFGGNLVEKGSKISFNVAGDYTIIYTYEDPYNYRLNEKGVLEAFTVTYVKNDVVNVAIVEPEAEHAKFTFARDSTVTEEILYNNNTYISAKGVTANGTSWGKITVGDKTIVYPIVTANVNRNTTSKECQVFYYVFKNVLSITDANGTVYSHEKGTGTDGKMPSNLKVVRGNELKVENNVFTNYNDTNLSRTGGKIFCYSSSSQEDAPEAFNKALAYKSPSGLGYSSSTRNYDAAVIVQYQFTDSNNATYYYYVGYKISNPNNGSSGDGTDTTCVSPDTLITLANGSQVRVDSLTGTEELLVWNLETGKYDTAPIVFVDNDAEQEFEIIHLYFSDGSDVKVISEHGFFDLDLGEYVYIDACNYTDYIGHRFVTEGDIKSNNWNAATLDEVVIETEVTTAWSPVTFEHLCYYTNGVLSMPGGIEGLFNIFEVDTELMRYDAEKMQKDIETYGLFTLEDFGGLITEEAFRAFNGAYLKVAMGKGLLTWEDIAYMAERYIPLM